ncbi:Zinc/cadmium resistance protein [Drechslerella dactyloides]|uniref:Zinc/cadmium resistance protein n=1 Tax=Drechslerella dactyloides TaxID=74499 RepID=A0AAD6J430_DREDA|nr:Zinc/cadmium resistance protein [Drechslerella dactyloides]
MNVEANYNPNNNSQIDPRYADIGYNNAIMGHLHFHMSKTHRLSIIIGISFTFFVAEISIGFYTGSLALIADAFHYLNDLIGFVVQLVAFKISERSESPKELCFGWQRANLLGAFFNGVFLLALSVSIFLQSIERFIAIEEIKDPKLVLIVGCIGLTLNLISAFFLHDHEEEVKQAISSGGESVPTTDIPRTSIQLPKLPQLHLSHRHETSPTEKESGHYDLGMMGVLLHVLGDAINNVGVIVVALAIWKAQGNAKYYADPAVSMFIAIMIFISALPLVKKTGIILLDTVPNGVNPQDVRYDLEQVPGVISVHELHIRRMNQRKTIASAHVVVSSRVLENFVELAKVLNQCFHAYGIHSATLQPELADEGSEGGESQSITSTQGLRRRQPSNRTHGRKPLVIKRRGDFGQVCSCTVASTINSQEGQTIRTLRLSNFGAIAQFEGLQLLLVVIALPRPFQLLRPCLAPEPVTKHVGVAVIHQDLNFFERIWEKGMIWSKAISSFSKLPKHLAVACFESSIVLNIRADNTEETFAVDK